MVGRGLCSSSQSVAGIDVTCAGGMGAGCWKAGVGVAAGGVGQEALASGLSSCGLMPGPGGDAAPRPTVGDGELWPGDTEGGRKLPVAGVGRDCRCADAGDICLNRKGLKGTVARVEGGQSGETGGGTFDRLSGETLVEGQDECAAAPASCAGIVCLLEVAQLELDAAALDPAGSTLRPAGTGGVIAT